MWNKELDQELSEHVWNPHDRARLEDEVRDADPSLSKRGAPKIPEQWSRVISVYGDDLTKVKAYITATDMMIVQGFQPLPFDEDEDPWRLLFSPKQFILDNPEFTLEDYRLTVHSLRDYGEHISGIRTRIREVAQSVDVGGGLNIGQEIVETSKVAMKMSRWNESVKRHISTADHRAFVELVPEAKRKRMKKKPKISNTEIVSIAYRVLVEKEYQTTVAKAFRVSSSRIAVLVKKVQSRPQTLTQMLVQRE